MSLRKSPTLTSAPLAANRRNAQKGTGPRTERGKAWARVNALRHGGRSRGFDRFFKSLMESEPGRARETGTALLSLKTVVHPLYLEQIEGTARADDGQIAEYALRRAQPDPFTKHTIQPGMLLKTKIGHNAADRARGLRLWFVGLFHEGAYQP